VISTKRKDALPRTGGVSAGRRKPVVLPPIDALTEPLATAVAAPKKKAHSPHQKKSTASRKKTTRAAGRASAKVDKPAAMEVAPAVAAVPETVEVAAPVPDPAAETVVAAEPPATAYEEFAVTALETLEVEALPDVETELEVEASAIVEELPVEPASAPSIPIGPPPIPEEMRAPPLARTTPASPAPRAPRHVRRSLIPVISRLLSTLCRWTGVSGTK